MIALLLINRRYRDLEVGEQRTSYGLHGDRVTTREGNRTKERRQEVVEVPTGDRSEVCEHVDPLVCFELAIEVVEDFAGAALSVARRHDRFSVKRVVVDPKDLTTSHVERVFTVVSGVPGVFGPGRDCA